MKRDRQARVRARQRVGRIALIVVALPAFATAVRPTRYHLHMQPRRVIRRLLDPDGPTIKSKNAAPAGSACAQTAAQGAVLQALQSLQEDEACLSAAHLSSWAGGIATVAAGCDALVRNQAFVYNAAQGYCRYVASKFRFNAA